VVERVGRKPNGDQFMVAASDPCPHCQFVTTAVTERANNQAMVEHAIYCRARREAPVIN
jgi:hypothetical protein